MSKKIVWVASKNPVKIDAARQGLETVFPGYEFELKGFSAPSGVPDQPIGTNETLLGAQNRLEFLKEKKDTPDYYVAIEGGIRRESEDCFAFAWILIENNNGLRGKAQTGHFMLPPGIVDLLDKGYELGDADDIVFNKKNSKQKGSQKNPESLDGIGGDPTGNRTPVSGVRELLYYPANTVLQVSSLA